jgi:hypothetical protein
MEEHQFPVLKMTEEVALGRLDQLAWDGDAQFTENSAYSRRPAAMHPNYEDCERFYRIGQAYILEYRFCLSSQWQCPDLEDRRSRTRIAGDETTVIRRSATLTRHLVALLSTGINLVVRCSAGGNALARSAAR